MTAIPASSRELGLERFNIGATYKYVPVALHSKIVYQLLNSAYYTDLTPHQVPEGGGN